MTTATITSKGQVTIPRDVREAMRLERGDRLEFVVHEDGSATIRPLRVDARGLIGMLRHVVAPDSPPTTVEEMDESIARHLAEDDARILRGES